MTTHDEDSLSNGWISLVGQTLWAERCARCGSLVTAVVRPSQPTNLSAVAEVVTALIVTSVCSPATHATPGPMEYISPLGNDVLLLTA